MFRYTWEMLVDKTNVKASPEVILELFHRLQKTPSGEKHAIRYEQFQRVYLNNLVSVVALILSDSVDEMTKFRLCEFSISGSSAAKANAPKHELHRILREHYAELPRNIQVSLDWYQRTHNW